MHFSDETANPIKEVYFKFETNFNFFPQKFHKLLLPYAYGYCDFAFLSLNPCENNDGP